MKKDFWNGRPVLVTGATGLLASWLIPFLKEKGARVVGYAHRRDRRKRAERVFGDVTDLAALERAMNEYEIETVFHLAAQSLVSKANENPRATFEANIRGTWCVLEAARRSPTVGRVIVASSDKAYAREDLPYRETTRLSGRHPYDVSKSCADLISRAYFTTYGLPVCVTRCGNFYGGRDPNLNRIVPQTILSALRGERPRLRSDGKATRDYLYIEDGVLAYMLLAERMDDRRIHGEAFNFSDERRTSALAMVKDILALMERADLRPIVMNDSEGENPHQYMSADKAKRLLGWKHRFSREEGLCRTIAWYRERFKS